ncbi:hypothetical protein CIPAW_05G161600 [Carya illinoinensis]|uniref:Pentatricopeptide repeat-containing protein n=1 Tax=Carya illinoinensis TaxID=32201 RepID=A0A8T1QK16_CARIL|nr:hypothetical protein CIPAW_05G161600 [Carya illinoinensis]
MTISTCSDWSVACINSCRDSHRFNLIPTCKSLPFFSVTRPRFLNFDVYSSGCSSPTLEEPSNSLPIIELNLEFPDSERCQKPDCGNLNDILRGLFADPQTQELAYEYYEKVKQRPEFRPERSTLKHVIRNCIRARKFKIVETLLQDSKANGEVSVSAFVSAMSGYNKLHMYRSTIAAFRQMESAGVLPDLKSYCHIMEAYAKSGDSERVVELFRELQSTQLNFYSSPVCGQIYGILCKSLSESGRAFEALEYFQEMTKKGIILKDSSVYSSLICSFARMREVKVAEQLSEEAKSKRMLRDPEAYLKLVLMYVEEGQMEKTLGIVKAMKDSRLRIPDCIFCAIVNGYSKKRGFEAAVKVYEELISQGCEPGQVTYSSIINAYSQLELYSKAEMVFSEMEKRGLDKSVVAYSSIIVMYGRMGRVRDAMRALAKMKERGCEPNVWIYNSLMEIHGKAKNLRRVEKLWNEMKRRKVSADKISYTIIISAYGKAREFETCVRYYKEFRNNGGVIDRVMAGIMVGVFSKSNRIGDLLKLLQDMRSHGTEFDGRLYSSALAALRDAGLLVQAQWLQDCFTSKMNLNS